MALSVSSGRKLLELCVTAWTLSGKRKGTRAHNQHGREKSHRRVLLRSASPLTWCIAVRPFHFLTAERTSREVADSSLAPYLHKSSLLCNGKAGVSIGRDLSP